MEKIIFRLYFFIFFVGLTFFLVVLTNSVGCDYEFQTKKKGIDYLGVCKGGQLSLVQTDVVTGDTWVVELLQLSIFKQLFWVVKEKKHTVASEKHSYMNDINNTSATNSVYNYAWRRLNDKQIAVFQAKPTRDVYLVEIDGVVDTWDSIFGYKSVFVLKDDVVKSK